MDGYVVRKVDPDRAEDKRQRRVDGVRYPPHDVKDMRVVVTELELWEVEANIGGYFSWSYWRSYFNRKPDYTVVIRQTDPENVNAEEWAHCFVLYESPNMENACDAFRVLRGTLEPLVDDCTVILTKGILQELLLPSPPSAERVIFHLVEVMERNRDAHPDWVSVLQAIAKPALQSGNDEGVMAICNRLEGERSDRMGDNLLHIAASLGSGKVIVNLLRQMGKDEERKKQLLEKKNRSGRTSLHIACESNNHEAVQELIRAGADLTAGEDAEGSTPLHLAAQSNAAKSISTACNKKDGFLFTEAPDKPQHIRMVEALNSRDSKGFTPLMLATRQGYIQSAMSLLLAEADPNITHEESGNTALHFAAKQGSETLTKMLIIFYANTAIKNKSGQSPLDLARASDVVGAEKCIQALQETIQLQERAEQASTSFEPFPVPQDTTFLLSVDGGGSRSLVSCVILIALYQRMKALKPDCNPLRSYFDYITGTSGGAILSLGLTHAKCTPELCRSLCVKCAEDVCEAKPTFSSESMDEYLKEAFSANLGMTDTEKPRVIVTTVLAERIPTELHLFRNYGEFKERRKVWECARASSAAPVYFTPFEDKYIDGGVMANNPTLDAMVEIFAQGKREKLNVKIGLVLSIGTGILPSDEAGSMEIYIPKTANILSSLLSLPRTIMSIRNLLQVFISQSTQSDGQETIRAKSWCESVEASYYRLSPQLVKIYDLAESDKAELTQLMYETHLYVLDKREEIDQIAKLLLSRGSRE